MESNLNILYEDNDIIVLEKPPGIPSQRDKTGDKCLADKVSDYLSGGYVGIIHRLDRPVGGIMVFAKNKIANTKLSNDILNKKFKKTYLAVVCGKAEESKYLHNYLLKNQRLNISKVVSQKTLGAKEALLEYKCISSKQTNEDILSIIEVELITGRHHQIRVQLSHEKLAIWGDTKYNEKFLRVRGFVNIALWAYKISFYHTRTGKHLEFCLKPNEIYPFVEFNDIL